MVPTNVPVLFPVKGAGPKPVFGGAKIKEVWAKKRGNFAGGGDPSEFGPAASFTGGGKIGGEIHLVNIGKVRLA